MLNIKKPFTVTDFARLFSAVKAKEYYAIGLTHKELEDYKHSSNYGYAYKVILSRYYDHVFSYLLYINDQQENHELDDIFSVISEKRDHFDRFAPYGLARFEFKYALSELLVHGSYDEWKDNNYDFNVYCQTFSFELGPVRTKKIIDSYDPQIVEMMGKVVRMYNQYEAPITFDMDNQLSKANDERIIALNNERQKLLTKNNSKTKIFKK